MRRFLFACTGLLLLLPAAAAATHFGEDASASGNCLGYQAAFDVEFHPAVFAINYAVTVTITSAEDEEMFRYEHEGVLERPDETLVQSYALGANWNDVTDEIIPLFGMMDVRVEVRLFFPEDSPFWSPSTYGKIMVVEDVLECAVVGADDVSWSSLKADFR